MVRSFSIGRTAGSQFCGLGPTTNSEGDFPKIAVERSVTDLRKLLVVDYRSTNEDDSFTSALAHQLIAEQLQTNSLCLDWASNAVKRVILDFLSKGDVPIYGAAGVTADSCTAAN
jgi:hypothetical protein